MLCDKCKQNEASVFFTKIINGHKQEEHLCTECAKQMGGISMGWDDNHDNLWQQFFGLFGGPTTATDLSCPFCKMTFREFENTGKFGCADCYTAFSSKITPMLERLHLASQHVTADDAPALRAAPRENVVELSGIEALKYQLQQAVSDEKFEEAAQLRDKIKGMQDSLQGGDSNA